MRFLYCSLSILMLIGCSSQQAVRTDPKPAPVAVAPSSARSVPDTHSAALRQTAAAKHAADSSIAVDSVITRLSSASLPIDTLGDDTELIDQRLEQVRQHYLLALASQESKDTVTSELEFETAIQILNDLSDFPNIDSSREFLDLSKSVTEDYEKYIAQIDNLGPYASLFALREKLNQEVEHGDTTGLSVPHAEVKGTKVPLPFNEYVDRALSFFMGRGSSFMERWLYLSGRYFPMMKRVFREEGVPEELVVLSMPESGLRTDARSWARAVGLWQFMKGTGSLYGLRQNWWYDERRDYEKATRAAARHLRDLYSELGDWNLVLASYNAGAGRVYRAIRRSGSTDYWEMRRWLPRQTRNYVPQFIAVARIVLDPKRHGFTTVEYAAPLAYDLVEINDCVDLRVLAKCAQTTVDTLQDLNPELLRWCTPPGVSGYRFRIPRGRKESFLLAYAGVPADQKRDWAIHTVRKGETISAIASRYGLSVSVLKELNNLRSDRRLSIGTTLAIPIPRDLAENRSKIPFDYSPTVRGVNLGAIKSYVSKSGASRARVREASKSVRSPKGRPSLAYHVKRGDTIGHIAEWYGVRASDIRNWNDIAYGEYIHAGQSLTVYVDPSRSTVLRRVDAMTFTEKQAMLRGEVAEAVPAAGAARATVKASSQDWIQHTVKSGESLDAIAKMYDVTVSDLKQWNALRTSRIKAGQRLDIYDKPEDRVRLIPQNDTRAQGQTQAQTVAAATHKVKKGETLYDIARHYGVGTKELKTHNKLHSNRILAGQILRIPSRTQS